MEIPNSNSDNDKRYIVYQCHSVRRNSHLSMSYVHDKLFHGIFHPSIHPCSKPAVVKHFIMHNPLEVGQRVRRIHSSHPIPSIPTRSLRESRFTYIPRSRLILNHLSARGRFKFRSSRVPSWLLLLILYCIVLYCTIYDIPYPLG